MRYPYGSVEVEGEKVKRRDEGTDPSEGFRVSVCFV